MAAYDWYKMALAGDKPPIHEGEPQAGFFIKKDKERGDQPVAIWPDNGQVYARIGFKDRDKMIDPVQVWSWVCGSPILENIYWSAFDTGRWPNDMAPVAPVAPAAKEGSGSGGDLPAGHNNPPPERTPAEEIAEKIDNAIKVAADALTKDGKLTVGSKDASDKAANARDRLRDLLKEADAAYRVEKKPHEDGLVAVRQVWFPIIEKAENTVKGLSAAMTAWLTAEQKRLNDIAEAARKVAAAEAEAARLAAVEAAKAGQPVQEYVAPPPVEPKRALAGGAVSGRRSGLRKVKVGKIVDQDKFYQAVRDQPEVTEALEKVANRMAKANVAMAGMEIEERQTA